LHGPSSDAPIKPQRTAHISNPKCNCSARSLQSIYRRKSSVLQTSHAIASAPTRRVHFRSYCHLQRILILSRHLSGVELPVAVIMGGGSMIFPEQLSEHASITAPMFPSFGISSRAPPRPPSNHFGRTQFTKIA
jgi:hypothetical protein